MKKDGQQNTKSIHPPATRIRAFDRIQKFRASRNYDSYDDNDNSDSDPNNEFNGEFNGGLSGDEYRRMLALATGKKYD
jgi:hypothetical protein